MMKDEKSDLEALEREFQRVGITWQAFRELGRLNDLPNMPPRADESFAMQMDIPAFLTLLRSLPNNAGQPAFVEAFRVRYAVPALERARAAARAEERKQESRKPHGSAGA